MGGLSFNRVGEGLETAWTSNNFTHIFNGERCCKMTKWKVVSIANTLAHNYRKIRYYLIISVYGQQHHALIVVSCPKLTMRVTLYLHNLSRQNFPDIDTRSHKSITQLMCCSHPHMYHYTVLWSTLDTLTDWDRSNLQASLEASLHSLFMREWAWPESGRRRRTARTCTL